jgi:hypothetical protein
MFKVNPTEKNCSILLDLLQIICIGGIAIRPSGTPSEAPTGSAPQVPWARALANRVISRWSLHDKKIALLQESNLAAPHKYL